MDNLKVSTINSDRKFRLIHHEIITEIDSQNIHIVAITEAGMWQGEEAQMNMKYPELRMYYNLIKKPPKTSNQSRHKGIIICIRKNLAAHVNNVITDGKGRLITLELTTTTGLNIGIVAFYMPTTNKKHQNQKAYLKTKYNKWKNELIDITDKLKRKRTHLILMGDANAVLNPSRDRTSKQATISDKLWESITTITGTTDTALTTNITPPYTWTKKGCPEHQARIDYILTDKPLTRKLESTTTKQVSGTDLDHRMIIANFNFTTKVWEPWNTTLVNWKLENKKQREQFASHLNEEYKLANPKSTQESISTINQSIKKHLTIRTLTLNNFGNNKTYRQLSKEIRWIEKAVNILKEELNTNVKSRDRFLMRSIRLLEKQNPKYRSEKIKIIKLMEEAKQVRIQAKRYKIREIYQKNNETNAEGKSERSMKGPIQTGQTDRTTHGTN